MLGMTKGEIELKMNRSKKVGLRAFGGLLLGSVAVIATIAACGDGEDRPGVVVVEESGSVSVSGDRHGHRHSDRHGHRHSDRHGR